MTKTIIIMENNHCDSCLRIAEINGIKPADITAIHCEYYPVKNETHIIITWKDK